MHLEASSNPGLRRRVGRMGADATKKTKEIQWT